MKGWKAAGNKVGEYKVLKVEHLNPLKIEDEVKEEKETTDLFSQSSEKPESTVKENGEESSEEGLKPGDSIDL